jgi:two-component system nitrogen regulation response regulator GlnG/two-component system response regulator HydG
VPRDDSTTEGTLDDVPRGFLRSTEPVSPILALAIVWSRETPERVGEVAFLEREKIFGRGDESELRFSRQRPAVLANGGPIESQKISRVQLKLKPDGESISVESLGRCKTMINGEQVTSGTANPGDTIRLGNELIFLAIKRRRSLAPLRSFPEEPRFAFGAPDPHAFVGESEAAWMLRDALAFAARAEGHVLVRGESGTGKELVAAAVHKLSSRGEKLMVSRNAATFPEGLVDAELFGNLKNYPTPGLPEREGVIGEANGSTLFLDEIGELPLPLQAHLLRVLDSGGEYQRLGDSRVRRADLRVVAATNRAVEALKHDFAARLALRLEVPRLQERREDIPLLISHLLERAAGANPHLANTFFSPGADGRRWARIDPELIDRLVRHDFTTHTRELNQFLWQALGESHGNYVAFTDGTRESLARVQRATTNPPALQAVNAEPQEEKVWSKEEIELCLSRSGGSVTKAARELGLANRFVLYRLMKKLGVSSDSEE